MRMRFGQMPRFEERNNWKINFFVYENELVPIRVSKKIDTDSDVNLFLLEDDLIHLYLPLTNLICLINGRILSSRFCPRRDCFHICSSNE